jgi:GTP-binding protein Era
MTAKAHKSGFVNIIGNPNVGKSTLMNALVGERLSIITSKAQTTRHRILGIVNGDDFQIIYSDTPGILNPKYKLQKSMLSYVDVAFDDADVLLYVTDVKEDPNKNEKYIEKLTKTKAPILLLINKIDLSNQEEVEELVSQWQETLPKAEIFTISALRKFNLGGIFDRVLDLLPEGPEYYPKDELTDKNERFFVEEIIREKILRYYQKEIPYSVEIAVESFKVEEKITRISAVIYVERNTQKGIIIGKAGSKLKRVGTESRVDIESFFEKKVFLELFVKVRKDWRDNDTELRRFGYTK